MSWTSIKAATYLTVHLWFGTTYTSVFVDLATFLVAGGFLLFKIYSREGGLHQMVRNWRFKWKQYIADGLGALAIFFCAWALVFFYNLHAAYRVFANPPQVSITWTHPDAFEVMPNGPKDITPEFLQSHHQYEIEVKSAKENTVPISVLVRFQFPYYVEQNVMYRYGAEAEFYPAPAPRLILKGRYIHIFGERPHRIYILSIPNMPPNGGGVRIVLILDSNAQDQAFVVGGRIPPNEKFPSEKPPVLPPPSRLGSPNEYIRISTTFSYGGQVGNTETYAPFHDGSDNTINLGSLGPVPPRLPISFEP
jgi:hypothetical protein